MTILPINQNKTHCLNLKVKQAGKLEVENFVRCVHKMSNFYLHSGEW